MWIRQVTARAFGPFKGEEIDLAPGLTVVIGANEAGKSSWHAAIYAGLCGIRRGKGRRHKDDELFAARHEPWDGGPWEVATVLELSDGRTIELTHDLAGHLTSSARDLDLGHDLTSEIINDGAPDGSVWLGLDRRAFAAVACVRQAEILSITDRAEAIQEHLQRAAATAGTDETAATALGAIEQYQRDHVGLDRANSTKPLRVALERVSLATDRFEAAQEAHADWLEREASVARLESKARQADLQLRLAKAARARLDADEMSERVARLEALAAAHPVEPPAMEADDELAAQVATALHGWSQRPTVERLEGPSAAELGHQLDLLPALPQGDLEAHPSVVAARRVLSEAITRAEAHQAHAPGEVDIPQAGGATIDQLEGLAQQLSTPVPEVDSALAAEVERLRAEAEQLAASRVRLPLVVAVAVLIAALGGAAAGLGLAGYAIPAVASGAAAGLILVVAVLKLVASRRRRPVDDGGAELRSAEARLVAAEEATARGIRQRGAAVEAVEELGLKPDPSALRALVRQIERAREDEAELERWQSLQRHIDEQVTSAVGLLVEALQARALVDEAGLVDPDPPALLALVDDYEQACRHRRSVAEQAASRPALESEIRARQQAEARVSADSDRLQRIETALIGAAQAAGVLDSAASPTTESDWLELVDRLRWWEQERAARRADREQAVHGWNRLQAQLDGLTLDDWRNRAALFVQAAEQLAQGLTADQLSSPVNLGARPDEVLRRLDDAAVSARLTLAEARRELAVRAENIDPVAEAAEDLATAEAELARVRRLDEVLTTTHQLMTAAQKRVHRDLAPMLAQRVKARLAAVTGGRYADVLVDPETLAVQVRDPQGRWRDAALLSQGTAEQVFLLLRVAMAEILTTDSCPLLLDDVTVQSDPARTRAVLDVLRQVSADHQVVLFSQEHDVANWARTNLGERDRLIELESVR